MGIKKNIIFGQIKQASFFLFLDTSLIIHDDWITRSICGKIQKRPLVYKTVILGSKAPEEQIE